jgi:hypothetical protein
VVESELVPAFRPTPPSRVTSSSNSFFLTNAAAASSLSLNAFRRFSISAFCSAVGGMPGRTLTAARACS